MANNQFLPEFHDKAQDNTLTTQRVQLDFDVHSLYKGLPELYPINAAQPSENSISMGGGSIYSGNDRLTPFKLPEVEIQQSSGQGSLDGLSQRITDKATDNVQKHMTPEEKKHLNEDATKYAKEMDEYKEHMRHVMMGTGGIGLDDPAPKKPESLVKYEQAIDKEIKKIVQAIV
jgi:hypothetical protein